MIKNAQDLREYFQETADLATVETEFKKLYLEPMEHEVQNHLPKNSNSIEKLIFRAENGEFRYLYFRCHAGEYLKKICSLIIGELKDIH